MKTHYKVIPIKKEETYDWILHKHYARRKCSIEYAFGLYIHTKLNGIITFGRGGGSYNNNLSIFQLIELNRLVVNSLNIKNILSFFVSKSIKLLPKPMAIISYADPNNGHHGYIYQATNWIYTGLSSAEYVFEKNGKLWHKKGLYNKYGQNGIEFLASKGYSAKKQEGKHRYYYFMGTKKQIKLMKREIKHLIKPYPKGDNERYDSSYQPKTQEALL